MLYKRIDPDPALQDLVREYWIVESDDPEPYEQKVVPDGFPEIIFHYGDPYRIRLYAEWEEQEQQLFAGQISRHFYLKNTGRSGMLGVKLMPTAPYRLTGMDMSEYTDRVVPLEQVFGKDLGSLGRQLTDDLPPEKKAALAERQMDSLAGQLSSPERSSVEQAVDVILDQKGLVRMGELAERLEVSRRHLERSFKREVGLSPKFYSRIIRFNCIFEVMKEGNDSWIDIALASGYFDQSHFIKEFKEFTGEEPSGYGFDEKTLANFFLNRG